ncbi:flagellar basal-body rod protein FlgG [Thalassobacillus cyri]|uniref:Flagellar basal-body rod protein FlgG n=1 Tax=Thalassobacillus cyri TaxID=571932 RepID=A0A1H4D7I9_9BACI|nr:flagellar hook-basal body protein [Thalassobacillus cyri]SEA68661.1 flagellar basal-body rod protein FlgG [Thalassobacillus cyri]
MLRGFYTAASGIIAQQRRQEALSNNMANANTPGYKSDQGVMRAFPELLMQRVEAKSIPPGRGLHVPVNQKIGSLNTGAYLQETIPDFAQGDIRETGVGTDMALINGNLPDEMGSLYFTVQSDDGEARYTRNGNFTVDGQGYLVTQEGAYVLDESGDPIAVDGMEFQVSTDGTVSLAGGDIPLGISYIANSQSLVKEGNTTFRLDEGEALDARQVAGVDFSVQQNHLERSNVDAGKTMTEMMNTYRNFEMNQRVLKAYDQSMDKAVNEIGRLR